MRKNIVVLACAVAVFFTASGCHKSSSAGGSQSIGSEADIPSGATRSVSITDPILNMTAYTMSIPAKWLFDGAVIQGTSCSAGPFPVFRMMSPDGLYGIKNLPRLDWAWSDSPRYTPKVGSDCLPYKREMSAAEVLKYMEGVLKVEHVRDEVPPGRDQFVNTLSSHSTPTVTLTGDMAGARVRYNINNIVIEERLVVSVGCMANDVLMLGRQHTCNAYVGRYWAPQGKFSDDIYSPIAKTLVINQQWSQRWSSQIVSQLKAMGERSTNNILNALEAGGRQRAAEASAFNQAQQMRQQQHDDFMASMQASTDASMARTAAGAAARQHQADDWCDYALDQQKRIDPNTGVISKDSNLYNYTWVNESGDRIQTNNINANPNGNGTGNWTLQENVK